MSFARTELLGNLGRDPQLRYTQQGTPVCDFSVAVNSRAKGQETTLWYKIQAWGKQAEFCSNYLVKGAGVFVRGELQIEKWTDRDGKEQTTLQIKANEIEFVGGKREVTGDDSDIGMPREGKWKGVETDDDLGF
jgi:single-strand DNA-binding protein